MHLTNCVRYAHSAPSAMGEPMRSPVRYKSDEIHAGKLRTLGYEAGIIHGNQILPIILISSQREIGFDDAEAQDVLQRSRHETLAERTTELLGITVLFATLVVAIPLFNGWGV